MLDQLMLGINGFWSHLTHGQGLVTAFVLSFITVGIKGFQHKNVIGNHRKLVFVTAVLMAIGDVATWSLVIAKSWAVALPLGGGAGTGMIASMWLHDRYIKPKG